MRVGRSDHTRARGMHAGVNGKSCGVHGIFALHHLAMLVHQYEVGGANLPEVHAEGIHPEMVGALRVAGGDVAGHALVESVGGKQAESRGQALLAVAAFFLLTGKSGALGHMKNVGGSGGHGCPPGSATEYSPGTLTTASGRTAVQVGNAVRGRGPKISLSRAHYPGAKSLRPAKGTISWGE